MKKPDTYRYARYALPLSLVSSVAYFSTSMGVRNFMLFIMDGIAKLHRMVG